MYLLDSDAAKKICQYRLLYELAGALGCTLGDFAVLPQLKFQLRLATADKALSKLGSPEAVDLAKQLVAAASEVVVVADSANPLLQLNRPDIDSGEATLFAALHGDDESALVSGDKRAFVALSKVDGVPVVDALWARLICLEEALCLVLGHADFQEVSDKVRSVPTVDMAISIAFGRAQPNPIQDVMSGLQSYLTDLQANTGGKYLLPG
ncbi:MAG: hypothetical protein ACRCTL_05745 [Pseudomonas sp.]